MRHQRKVQKMHARCIFLLSIFLMQSSFAMSRMGTATITDSEGIPCFSIPENSETRDGLPLYGIFVSELPDGVSSRLPPDVWSVWPTDFDAPPKLMPSHCIRYGENPESTILRRLEPLALLKVYSVFIQAKHEGSSMIGYTGKFCIKPAGSGRTFVQVIPEDRSLGEARFAGCTR